jgi:predicted nucleic acid-binding protein
MGRTQARGKSTGGSQVCPQHRFSIVTRHWPADRRLADLAADFKARFKISLADAFAAALAKDKKAELVTGDQDFKLLGKEISIHWLQ